MENVFVQRGYSRLQQAALLPFAQNCCSRVLDNPVYATAQELAQTLRQKCEAYQLALHTAENRGRDTVAIKNQARVALITALDRLSYVLQIAAASDPAFLINAGFAVRFSARRRLTGLLPAPQKLRISQGKTSGEALIEFEGVDGAHMYAIELGESAEGPWQNGNYASARRIAVPVVARRETWARVSTIGRGNRKGPWSEPVMAFIP